MANEKLARFLAHSVELEREARRCYLQLAGELKSAGNFEVADFFARMAEESNLHLAEVAELAEGMQLPDYSEDEFDWAGDVPPESTASGDATPSMSLREAILLALVNERAANKFYAAYATNCGDPETRVIAAQFAADEASHAQQLVARLARIQDRVA
ncbi:ferritin-like domain-containing protein [Haliea sp. E17]|uniref:ferritin-like domain-containing protein n=1 Tax=Haliea sp. E17 TaxID=3401576 RepID=UPI003AB0D35C